MRGRRSARTPARCSGSGHVERRCGCSSGDSTATLLRSRSPCRRGTSCRIINREASSSRPTAAGRSMRRRGDRLALRRRCPLTCTAFQFAGITGSRCRHCSGDNGQGRVGRPHAACHGSRGALARRTGTLRLWAAFIDSLVAMGKATRLLPQKPTAASASAWASAASACSTSGRRLARRARICCAMARSSATPPSSRRSRRAFSAWISRSTSSAS